LAASRQQLIRLSQLVNVPPPDKPSLKHDITEMKPEHEFSISHGVTQGAIVASRRRRIILLPEEVAVGWGVADASAGGTFARMTTENEAKIGLNDLPQDRLLPALVARGFAR